MSSAALKILWLFFICHLLASFASGQRISKQVARDDRADTDLINFFNRKGATFLQKNLDSSYYYSRKAKGISKQAGYPYGTAEASLHLSSYFNSKGNYALATTNALEALRIFDSLGLSGSVGDVYIQLAYIFKTMASQNRTPTFLNAGVYYNKMAYDQYEKVKDTAGMVNSLNVGGILYRDIYYAEKKEPFFDTAFSYYQKAVELIDKSGKGEQYRGKLYNNISQVYNEYKRIYTVALYYLFKAVDFNKLNNNKVSLLYNYGNISSNYLQLKNYDRALEYAYKMLEGTKELGQPNREHDALYELFKIYKSRGQYKEALNFYLQADRITDSLSNVEKTEQVAQLRAAYEAERSEMKINQLSLEKQDISKRNMLLSVGLGIFFLLAIGMIILYRRVQLQKKRIGIQSAWLTTMMKELHHRVKNNLQIVNSLLSLQSYKTTDKMAIAAFRESQQRVQAMSLIHQKLYDSANVMNVNMEEYLTDLAQTLLVSFGYNPDSFILEVSVAKDQIDVDKALPIGLIANEVITNALKYAYNGVELPQLTISLKEDNNNLILKVKDNGIGLDLVSWKEKTQSFGKQLIYALSTQLRASQEIAVHNGTLFTLIVPMKTVS